MSDKTKLKIAQSALREIASRNSIKNDADAYDLRLAEWGLGLIDERPLPEDFGQEETRLYGQFQGGNDE